MLTIATINVNGIRAAVRRGMPAWIEARQPDVMLLQEVRAPDAVIHELLGPQWHIAHIEAAAKGRAGVAVASRLPIVGVRPALPLPSGASEEFAGDTGRWIEADVELPDGSRLTAVSTYLYSGTVDTPSMDWKYAHLDRVTDRLRQLRETAGGRVVVGGDINIGHRELDIKNWRGNRTKAGFLPAERAYLDRWYGEVAEGGLGLVDVGRRVAGEVAGPYTWWSWRGQAFDNDSGWRIDVQITTAELAERVRLAAVDRAASYAERFSDHAPFVVSYDVG